MPDYRTTIVGSMPLRSPFSRLEKHPLSLITIELDIPHNNRAHNSNSHDRNTGTQHVPLRHRIRDLDCIPRRSSLLVRQLHLKELIDIVQIRQRIGRKPLSQFLWEGTLPHSRNDRAADRCSNVSEMFRNASAPAALLWSEDARTATWITTIRAPPDSAIKIWHITR